MLRLLKSLRGGSGLRLVLLLQRLPRLRCVGGSLVLIGLQRLLRHLPSLRRLRGCLNRVACLRCERVLMAVVRLCRVQGGLGRLLSRGWLMELL